jgi:hypothetical protein
MSSALSSLESKASASGSPVSQRVWLVMPAILPEPRQTAARTFAWLLVHHVVRARLQSEHFLRGHKPAAVSTILCEEQLAPVRPLI